MIEIIAKFLCFIGLHEWGVWTEGGKNVIRCNFCLKLYKPMWRL